MILRAKYVSAVAALLLQLCCANVFAQTLRFVYPPGETIADQRHVYYWDMLQAALEANRDKYGAYELAPYPTPMNFQRAVVEVQSGTGRVNIVARATNLDLEKQLLPVRIPLDKGLLGYRLFLVMPEVQARVAKVRSLQELQQFSIGQASPWTDVRILRAAGFNVVLADDYEGLFQMLGARRFDLFSRGVNEIEAEWQAHKDLIPGISIENSLVLHYPMPRYFFVPRTQEGARMAERIEDGLRRMQVSGEFERRYQDYKKGVLKGVNLAGRKVFRLSNPELSPQALVHERFWWEDLATELAPPAVKRLTVPLSAPAK